MLIFPHIHINIEAFSDCELYESPFVESVKHIQLLRLQHAANERNDKLAKKLCMFIFGHLFVLACVHTGERSPAKNIEHFHFFR